MRKTGSNIRSDAGFALVVTLLVTAILVAVVVEFAYSVYVSTARAANFSDSQRAAVLAANGVELAGSAIEMLRQADPNMVMGRSGLVFARREGELSVELRVIDESAKVSTAVVYPDTGVKNDRVYDIYARLIKALDLDERLVDLMADWIDSDTVPRVHGAEAADFYMRLASPYSPKNGLPSSFDELGMVKGYTPEVLDKLRPYVSPYNTTGLVNINTAPREVIMSLAPEITRDLADGLITHRKSTPFRDRSEVMSVVGFGTIGFNLQDKIIVTSDVFRVYSKATVGETTREVEAVVKPGSGILYWREP